ncbi:MAG TPA: hypothetical protein VF062_08235 [Candidatus Limnocylindrales bacterium]
MTNTFLGRASVYAAVTVTVIAASLIAAAPAHAELPVTRPFLTSDHDSEDLKSVTVPCPDGRRVIGGGASMTGGDHRVHLFGLHPNEDDDSFTALAKEDAPYAGSWSLTVVAVCAYLPGDLPGYDIVSAATTWTSSTTKTLEVDCPDGTVPLSFGARVAGSSVSKLLLTIVAPNEDEDGAYAGAKEAAGGYDGTWKLTVWAVCADTPEDWDIVSFEAATNWAAAGVDCGPWKVMIGVGGWISLSLGEVYLSELVITGSGGIPTYGWATAMEDANGAAHDWNVTGYAVCVTP